MTLSAIAAARESIEIEFVQEYGHATDKGNQLIAENLANVILAMPESSTSK